MIYYLMKKGQNFSFRWWIWCIGKNTLWLILEFKEYEKDSFKNNAHIREYKKYSKSRMALLCPTAPAMWYLEQIIALCLLKFT